MTSQINNLTISDKGLALIKEFEGLRLTPYRCSAGYWTIGWGHRFTNAELLTPGILKRTILAAEAVNLLNNDTKTAVQAVNAAVTVRLTQYQFDALVSFTFNLGIDAFKHSTLLRKLNAGDVLGAASEFMRWIKERDPKTKALRVNEGLVRRRQNEWRVFLGVEFIQNRKSGA